MAQYFVRSEVLTTVSI